MTFNAVMQPPPIPDQIDTISVTSTERFNDLESMRTTPSLSQNLDFHQGRAMSIISDFPSKNQQDPNDEVAALKAEIKELKKKERIQKLKKQRDRLLQSINQ
jgi:hypothetical protein